MSKIYLDIIDLEQRFREDIETKNGFILDENVKLYEDLTNEGLLEGNTLHSYKFAIPANAPSHILAKQYSCECESLTGSANLGVLCENCGTIVERNKESILKRAWIDLGTLKVLTPLALGFLSETFKTKFFEDSLFGNNRRNETRFGEFLFIDLYDKWDEFIDAYTSNSQSKRERAEFLKKNREKFFTTKLPVVSSRLRYLSVSVNMGVKKFTSHELNACYATLLYSCIGAKRLNEEGNRIYLSVQLKDVYSKMYTLFNLLYTDLGGSKNKLLRSSIVSMRAPYTARNIIVPYTGINNRPNVCIVHYDVFRCLFSKDIESYLINKVQEKYLRKLLNLSYKLNDVDKEFLRKEVFPNIKDKYILTSREPVIYYTAMFGSEIIDLTDSKTLQIPTISISAQAADFDGDEFLMFGLDAKIRRNVFEQTNCSRYVLNFDRTYASGNVDLINDKNALTYAALTGSSYTGEWEQ